MKKSKKVMSAVLAATMVAGMSIGTTEAFARSSKRAAWNNAAGSVSETSEVKDLCFVEDDSESDSRSVYSNVYANSEEWSAWQEKWKSIRNNYEQVSLTPGEDATMLNFAWYSMTNETPVVKLMDANGNTIKEFTGVQDTANGQTITDNGSTVTLYPNKVTVTNLTENTSYKYAYLVDGVYSDTYTYETKSTESFSALYVGDPQIGASTNQLGNETKEYYAMNDSYNWNHTLANALSAFPNVSFMLSAGDQINQTNVGTDAEKLQQQIEYAGFLSASQLRSLPIATTIGNHDSKSVNYSNHFNYPNKADLETTTASASAAGTDYYFTYGNTLFISIDTNNYNVATHENVIKEATQKNPNATWRILMFHQDIYGSGYDHSDSDGIILRTQLTPVIDKYDIDAVLQGHDHTYSRTYQLSSDGLSHSAYDKSSSTDDAFRADNLCYNLLTKMSDDNKVIDPEGTVYFEANSATGSKFYQLIGTQQDYIAARCQSWRPTYSVLDITATTLTVKTYDAATNTELVADGGVQTAYTIVKQADKTALNEEIKSSQNALDLAKTEGNYTDESILALENTIAAAKAVADDAQADDTAIASAITSLQDAVSKLAKNPVTEAPTETPTEAPTETPTEAPTAGSIEAGKGSGDVNTGDESTSIVWWFALAGTSLAGLSAVIASELKKKKQNEQ